MQTRNNINGIELEEIFTKISLVEDNLIERNNDKTTVQFRGIRTFWINGIEYNGGHLYIYPEQDMMVIDPILGGTDIPINLLKTNVLSFKIKTMAFKKDNIITII